MRYTKRMRLGLFGGRFDPPHLGHLLAAQHALEQLELDELWFVPAKAPPHKPAAADAHRRYEMTVLATASHPQFKVSRIEIERSGMSFTFDTLHEVRDLQPQAELYFITGIDAYREVHSWHRAKEVVTLAQMVAVPRPGYDLNMLEPFFEEKLQVLDAPQCGISSTEVRRRIETRRPVRYFVPEPVESYLAKHDLYRQPVYQS
jgi:nicotinate-nucleotide adenylyltransferase